MFLPIIYILPICIHNIIILLWTSTLTDASDDNTLNLKIGFDLTQGENGAPSLRIREFDESAENRPRAFDNEADKTENSEPAVRADSVSSSDETSVTRDNPDNVSKDIGRDDPVNSDEDDDYDNAGNRIRSTKGLSPGEYEPEDNPKIHESYKGYPGSDSEGIKFRSARKQGVSWF